MFVVSGGFSVSHVCFLIMQRAQCATVLFPMMETRMAAVAVAQTFYCHSVYGLKAFHASENYTVCSSWSGKTCLVLHIQAPDQLGGGGGFFFVL